MLGDDVEYPRCSRTRVQECGLALKLLLEVVNEGQLDLIALDFIGFGVDMVRSKCEGHRGALNTRHVCRHLRPRQQWPAHGGWALGVGEIGRVCRRALRVVDALEHGMCGISGQI